MNHLHSNASHTSTHMLLDWVDPIAHLNCIVRGICAREAVQQVVRSTVAAQRYNVLHRYWRTHFHAQNILRRDILNQPSQQRSQHESIVWISELDSHTSMSRGCASKHRHLDDRSLYLQESRSCNVTFLLRKLCWQGFPLVRPHHSAIIPSRKLPKHIRVPAGTPERVRTGRGDGAQGTNHLSAAQ